ncbi:MAG TPA: aspartate aminotransferase family protein, partial [Pseudogracilibacillus sp.]|nr:aspartate aminotransferase family protein [Pseudogracilibacillus sp.]
RKHVLHPGTNPKAHLANGPRIVFSEGDRIYLKDLAGKTYIDGVSMLWNVNLGHGIEEIAKAAYDQMSKAAYTTTFYGYTNEPAARLAEKIVSLTPGDLNTIFFTSGGSESNESAFKLSRNYWEMKGQKSKRKIITLRRGYHGVTVAASLATGIQAYRDFTGDLDVGIITAEPHLTECELGDKSHPEYENSIRGVIEREGADNIAAVIMEPIQGTGGVHVPPEGYLQAVRKLCDEYNIHFIADEVITGFGRTGKMFGVNQWDVVPDFMSVAKGITSGYAQLGGVVMKDEIRDTIAEYDNLLAHGFTYSGHPTACAVGLKNVEILERDGLIENARVRGEELLAGVKRLEDKYDFVTNTRGHGLLAGFDLMKDPATNTPFDGDTKAAARVVEECFNRDLLIRPFDFEPGMNVVAVSPPLVIEKEEVNDILNRLDDALAAFKKTL